jgi:hypothetical protein
MFWRRAPIRSIARLPFRIPAAPPPAKPAGRLDDVRFGVGKAQDRSRP